MHPSGMFPFHPLSLPLRAAAQRGLRAGLGSIASPTVSSKKIIGNIRVKRNYYPLLLSLSPTCVMGMKGMKRLGEEESKRDLLPSHKHPSGRFPVHPPRLTRQLFQPRGSGRGVEGFTSGRPDPRPEQQAMKNTTLLYKYFTTHLLYPMKRRELAATIILNSARETKGERGGDYRNF